MVLRAPCKHSECNVRRMQMHSTDRMLGPRSVLEMQCHHVAGGWRCRFHSGSRAVWGPGLCSFKAVSGSSADARMSTPLSLGLVCNCWLRWARCPDQRELSLVRQDEPHLARATPEPCARAGAAEHPSWSRGRGDRREQGLAPPLVPGLVGCPASWTWAHTAAPLDS